MLQTRTAASSQVQTIAKARVNLPVRTAPSMDASTLSLMMKGDTARVVGRTASSDWLQIVYSPSLDLRGWILAESVETSGGGIAAIPVVPSGGAPIAASTSLVSPANLPALTPVLVTVGASSPNVSASSDTPPNSDANPTESGGKIFNAGLGIVLLAVAGGFAMVAIGGVFILMGPRKRRK
jgi:hypothetical protein